MAGTPARGQIPRLKNQNMPLNRATIQFIRREIIAKGGLEADIPMANVSRAAQDKMAEQLYKKFLATSEPELPLAEGPPGIMGTRTRQ